MSVQKSGAIRAVNSSEETEARADEAKPVAAEQSAAPSQAAAPEKKKRKSFVLPIIAIAALAGGGWYGYQWWTDGRFLISTDDAYVKGDIAVISPKVSGYVAKVDIVANQEVKAGDPMVTLDDGDYRNALEQAQAQLETQQLSLNRIDAQIAGAEASLAQAVAQKGALDAALRGADINLKRATELQSKDVGTAASSDNAQIAMEQAKANLVAGEAGVVSAQANIDLLRAQRKEAEGSVKSLEISRDKAARDLSFTVLRAPYDGVIGNLSVQTGDLVSVGKRLASLVPMDDLYIDANFKETQLAKIEPGSKVRVHVDPQPPARSSPCCRRKMPRGISPRSFSACRSVSSSPRRISPNTSCGPV
jgi:membrane fusion protein (multidrug efflux system)